MGVTVVFASIGIISDIVLQLETRHYFERRRAKRILEGMSGRYIVCGAGRVRPHVLSFFDVASAFQSSPATLDIDIEQVRVSPRSRLVHQTLEQSRLRHTLGVIVLAVIKAQGSTKFNPAATLASSRRRLDCEGGAGQAPPDGETTRGVARCSES